jgi:DNA-binding XRE family transcriptional regulator
MRPGLRPGRDADDDEYARRPWPSPPARRIVPTDTAELFTRQGLSDTAEQLLRLREAERAAGAVAGGPEPVGRAPVVPPPPPDPAAELADHLRRAWIAAGRPSMSYVGDEVGYSKASISKVLSGKMAPAWQLVRKLGVALRVPKATVQDVWHPLWIAADTRRRHATTPDVRPAERTCPRCGCVVAERRDHDAWHAGLDALLRWDTLRNAVRRRED